MSAFLSTAECRDSVASILRLDTGADLASVSICC